LYWEAGQGLFNLLKEFAATKEAMEAGQPTEFADAFKFAIASGDSHTISSVPFDHLVQVYQAAQGDHERALEIISRTGFERYVVSQRNEIINEFGYVRNWLRDHAPETVKFSVQPALPDVGLSIEQTAFLDALAESVATASLDGQAMHEAIYAAKETVGLKPAEAFKALYGVILDKDSGPKAGWFLASLDQEWLVARLRRQS
jgi:lysyl-tRNA synthetase class 1